MISKQQLEQLLAAAEKATIIKPIPGCDGYYADCFGDIFSINSRWGKWRKLSSHKDIYGYPKIKILRDGKLKKTAVHKMVCLAWYGLPITGQEVRHLDGTRDNNNPFNLSWGTRSENAKDRIRHGNNKSAENGRKSAYKLKGRKRNDVIKKIT